MISNCLAGKNEKRLLVRFVKVFVSAFSFDERRKKTKPKKTEPIIKVERLVVSTFPEKIKGTKDSNSEFEKTSISLTVVISLSGFKNKLRIKGTNRVINSAGSILLSFRNLKG